MDYDSLVNKWIAMAKLADEPLEVITRAIDPLLRQGGDQSGVLFALLAQAWGGYRCLSEGAPEINNPAGFAEFARLVAVSIGNPDDK